MLCKHSVSNDHLNFSLQLILIFDHISFKRLSQHINPNNFLKKFHNIKINAKQVIRLLSRRISFEVRQRKTKKKIIIKKNKWNKRIICLFNLHNYPANQTSVTYPQSNKIAYSTHEIQKKEKNLKIYGANTKINSLFNVKTFLSSILCDVNVLKKNLSAILIHRVPQVSYILHHRHTYDALYLLTAANTQQSAFKIIYFFNWIKF